MSPAFRKVVGGLPFVRGFRDYVRALERERDELRDELGRAREEARTLRGAAEAAEERSRAREEEALSLREAVGGFPPGHFHSPIPDREELRRRRDDLFGTPPAELPGIDLAVPAQLALLERLSEAARPSGLRPVPGPENRYGYENTVFGACDASVLDAVVRHFRPARLVEVGSGHSTCVVLDARDDLGGRPALTLVEPWPERLEALVRPGDLDRVTLVRERVEEADRALFAGLEAGDVLFIDSTHVSRIGSDVNVLLLEVLPALKPGVLVHVHDVFHPFDYPEEWVVGRGWFWNEAYLLRALLAGGGAFEVVFFVSYLQRFHRSLLETRLPLCAVGAGGSIWLRKR
jgi:hypothetical protein